MQVQTLRLVRHLDSRGYPESPAGYLCQPGNQLAHGPASWTAPASFRRRIHSKGRGFIASWRFWPQRMGSDWMSGFETRAGFNVPRFAVGGILILNSWRRFPSGPSS